MSRPSTNASVGLVVVFTLLAGIFSNELAAQPAISHGWIAADTKWETPYYVVDSGIVGPTVVLTGGIHGNEPAGYRAAEQIRHWPIVKGRLIVVPCVNLPGLRADTRRMPGLPEQRADLNRMFVVSENGEVMPNGTLATALWTFVEGQEPDWVIDLHEGFEFHVSHKPPAGKKRSVGSSIIAENNPVLAPMVERALAGVNAQVDEQARRFIPIRRPPIAGSFARAAAENLGAQAMILETTFKDQPISLRTRQHRVMVDSLFRDIGLTEHRCSNRLTGGTSTQTILVGLYDGPGTGSSGKVAIPRIGDESERVEIHFLGTDDMEPDVLQQFDLLFFPGGSGSKQANAIGEARRQHIRTFVHNGGGYVGVCAGAYLCSAHYSWSLNLIDSKVFTGSREIEGLGRKQMWYRGGAARVKLELSEAGQQIFTSVPQRFTVKYQNGPIIAPKLDPGIEDYTVLAWFRSEKVLYEPQRGTMLDTPAIVSGRYGKGRVVSISPHPEADKALESIIVDSITWAAGSHSP